MNRSDNDIKDFFAALSKADSEIKVPKFEELYPRKSRFGRRIIIPIGIAASVLILLGIFFFLGQKQEIEAPGAVVIVLSEDQENGTRSLMEVEEMINSWESPTSSLIDDFHE